MSKKLEGGFLGARPSWALSNNTGVWSPEQQLIRRRSKSWPALSIQGSGAISRYTDPLIGSYGEAVAFSPSGDAVAVVTQNGSRVYAFKWSSSGYGPAYSAPSTWGLAGVPRSIAFSKTGSAIAIGHRFSPQITVAAWSPETGFGAKYADPAVLPQDVYGIDFFLKDGKEYMALAHASSPYISVYPFSLTTGIGVRYPNPSPLPSHYLLSAGFSVCFSPDGKAVIFTFNAPPYMYAYRWDPDNGGFTGSYSNPTVGLPNTGLGIAFSPSGDAVAIAHLTSPYISVYKWSSTDGFGDRFSDPSSLPTGSGQSVAFSPDAKTIAIGHENSPFFTSYFWSSTNGFGAPYSTPSQGAGGAAQGIKFSPDGSALAMATQNIFSGSSGYSLNIYQWSS